MNLWIPQLSDVIELSEDWTFDLYFEKRNVSLLKLVCPPEVFVKGYPYFSKELVPYIEETLGLVIPTYEYNSWNGRHIVVVHPERAHIPFTIPKGEMLKFARFYIRQNQENYNSVTFIWNKKRFWTKLIDANKIQCEVVNGKA